MKKIPLINYCGTFLPVFIFTTLIFSVFFIVKAYAIINTVPESFDWRYIHGKNLISPERNNPNKNGCFADASAGLMESSINLYYNRQLNLNLSEQAGRDCFYATDNNSISLLTDKYNPDPDCPTDGSYRALFSRRALNAGSFDEACDPFRNEPVSYNKCSSGYICEDWQSRVWKSSDYMELYTARIANFDIGYLGYDDYYGEVTEMQCSISLSHAQYIENEDDFKKELIRNGPMHAVVDSWGHEMLLVGYYTAKDWTTVDYCNDRNRRNGFCSADGCVTFSADCDAELLGEKTCYQSDLYECVQDLNGDYNLQRTPNSCEEPSCNTDEIGSSKCINDGIYVCTEDDLMPYWQRSSDCSGICLNDQCVSNNTAFNTGDKRCMRNGGDNHFIYQEYSPGNTETFWTFKNQNEGGLTFGDDGFISIMIPYTHLISGVYFKGPYTLPTNSSYVPQGFDGTINCEDLDSDNYCNWGVSLDKPESCAISCNELKDCDDSNPNLNFYDQNMNCVSNIDLGISASSTNIIGSTYDIDISINNAGSATAQSVVLSFIKGYDLILSSSGLSCTVNEAEYTVSCTIPTIASGETVNGTLRMTSLDPNSRYDFTIASLVQIDPNPEDNIASINLINPIQQCEITFNGSTSVQDCMDIDNSGTYYTTRGDLIRTVCTTPGTPLASGCTLYFQILYMNTGIRVVDTASGNNMIWGQGGTNDNSPKLRLLSDSNIPIGEIDVTLEDNLDWSSVRAATNTTDSKAFIHNLTSAPGTADIFTLFIPYHNGDIAVGICPGAQSLDTVNASCQGIQLKRESDSDTEIVTINGQQYWKISGLTGTGGYSIQGTLLTRTGDNVVLPLFFGFGFLMYTAMVRIRKLRYNAS